MFIILYIKKENSYFSQY